MSDEFTAPQDAQPVYDLSFRVWVINRELEAVSCFEDLVVEQA